MADIIVDTQTNVNTYTTGAQQFSEVAALSDGGWVVTWTSSNQDGNTDGVYQQRYNADGSKYGNETLVNTSTAGSQQFASVTGLDDGGWVVTWQGNGTGGTNYDIYQQRYNANGTVNGGETRVNTTTNFYQEYPNVTALSDGGWVVTYSSQDQSHPDRILQQRFGVDGLAVNGEIVVEEFGTTGGNYARPNVAFLADGGWIVAYQAVNGTSIGNSVFFKHYDATGDLVDDRVTVYADTGSGNPNNYTKIGVETLADGGWMIVWSDQGALYTQRYDDDGQTVGNRTSVATASTNTILYPDVVTFPDGGWGVTWYASSSVWMQVYDSTGAAVSDPVEIDSSTSGSDTYPRTTALSDGRVVVTWMSSTADGDSNGIVQTVVTMPTTSTVALDEDTPHAFTHSEFDFSVDSSSSLASIVVTDLPDNGTLTLDGNNVSVGQTIVASNLDDLVWTPDANANGDSLASLKFNSVDADGHVNSAKVIFDVAAAQDAPTAADNSFTLDQNKAHTFTASEFGFSDTADGDTLASIKITALPENGTLMLSGQEVTLNQVITTADIANLVWTPAADAYGDDLASLSFTVTDSGGSTSVSSNTITFDVTQTVEYGSDPESVVNTYTTGYQQHGSVTGLGDGGWLVTWSSAGPDDSSTGIYQRRFDADGNAVGGETLVNTITDDQQVAPAVTALSDGGWLVTWMTTDSFGGLDLHQQRFTADGTVSGVETLINTTTVGDQMYPEVTALSGGGWLVTWMSHDNGQDWGIYQQRFAADGTATDGETHVNTFVTESQTYPVVTGLSDGGWLVTWMSYYQDNSDGTGIYQQRYAANGSAVGGETLVNTTTTNYQDTPTVTALADGGWLVAWEAEGGPDSSGYGVYQQRYDADGATVGDETLVNTTTTGSQSYPSVTALSNGGWAVVWTSTSSGDSDIVMQVYDADGDRVGSETVLNTYTQSYQANPHIAQLPNGAIIVTWESDGQDGDGTGIYQTVVEPFVSDHVAIDEDTTHTFGPSDFNFSVADDATLVSITVKALPDNGTLTLNGQEVTVGQVIAAGALEGLTWVPDANDNGDGLANFKFKSLDSNGDTLVGKLSFMSRPSRTRRPQPITL